MVVKLKLKEQKNEYERKIDKMKLRFIATHMAPSGLRTHSAIKDFTLLCVIKRKFLLVALELQALLNLSVYVGTRK
jgi:hypothetical protein